MQYSSPLLESPRSIQFLTESGYSTLELPDPNELLLQGVRWGRCDELFSPAFWKAQVWFYIESGEGCVSQALGQTLEEEVSACLLGGYGIPAKVGWAAFCKVRDEGLLASGVDPYRGLKLHRALSEPLILGNKVVKYRFATQRSKYLADALNKLGDEEPPCSHRDFRSWLLQFNGIGFKTASWITRNWLQSDEVAVIDVHIRRAGMLMNLYSEDHSPQSQYLYMESLFLGFAHRLGVRPSILDAIMWRDMRVASTFARELLEQQQGRY